MTAKKSITVQSQCTKSIVFFSNYSDCENWYLKLPVVLIIKNTKGEIFLLGAIYMFYPHREYF